MALTKWDEHDMENKLISILGNVATSKAGPDEFGYRYLTSYQLAIAFAERYPAEFAAMRLPIGGQGVGQRNSLAQYLAGELIRRIAEKKITRIEAAYLSKAHKAELAFRTKTGERIESSLTGAWDTSMFRLRGK
jgi:hypothetical protein